jgi:hypothetical protein
LISLGGQANICREIGARGLGTEGCVFDNDGQAEQFKDVRGDRFVAYTHDANARRTRGRR